jgi:hypothetical protein
MAVGAVAAGSVAPGSVDAGSIAPGSAAGGSVADGSEAADSEAAGSIAVGSLKAGSVETDTGVVRSTVNGPVVGAHNSNEYTYVEESYYDEATVQAAVPTPKGASAGEGSSKCCLLL